MADYLMANGVTHARGIYWDAYRITFLSRERVIVASQDVVRVAAYQAAVAARGDRAVTLVRAPCTGPVRVDVWCIAGGPLAAGVPGLSRRP
jgi:hypothetical protein